jgi:hypothetical protein
MAGDKNKALLTRLVSPFLRTSAFIANHLALMQSRIGSYGQCGVSKN